MIDPTTGRFVADGVAEPASPDAPAGMAPVGTSPEALKLPLQVTEMHKLYGIVFGMSVGIRGGLYVGAVVAFFAMGATWPCLGTIVALLAGGRLLAKAHSWAWKGFKKYSLDSADPAMRERILYEKEQQRASKAAEATARRLARARGMSVGSAAILAREQIEKMTSAAERQARESSGIERDKARAAAIDARRLAEDSQKATSRAIAAAQETVAELQEMADRARAQADAASAASEKAPLALPETTMPPIALSCGDDDDDAVQGDGDDADDAGLLGVPREGHNSDEA